MAVAFVQSKLGVDPSSVAFTSAFANDVAKHVFLKQSFVCIPQLYMDSTMILALFRMAFLLQMQLQISLSIITTRYNY